MRTILFTALLAPSVAAAAPQFLSHSGRLMDNVGVPLNGTANLTFRLVTSGDAERYSQTTAVDMQDGYYTVQLGSLARSIFTEDLDIEISSGSSILGRQTLMSTPYSLAVDGSVRVSSAPSDCTGLAGQLRYSGGAMEVCDGTTYAPLASASGTVGFGYDQDSTGQVVSGAIPWDDTVPQISEGSEVLTVTHTANSTSNLLVLQATVVWSENGNNSDQFTVALFRNGVTSALAATADSSSNGNSGCGAGSGYLYACTTSLQFIMPAPSVASETYQIRIGVNGPSVRFNQGITGQDQGDSLTSSFMLTEVAP